MKLMFLIRTTALSSGARPSATTKSPNVVPILSWKLWLCKTTNASVVKGERGLVVSETAVSARNVLIIVSG
ncbi:hypothetical protein GOP47_0027755 [Adiantum capillus-veneris]|nr:hypothetical protein GOP47_0027755 [Adiantum capillus-veneris]